MNWGAKPVIMVGNGCAGYDLSRLYTLGVPILTSWQGADLIDNFSAAWFGRTGIYGQRAANRILYEADQVLVLGCRMSPWTIGHAGLRPEQELLYVDIDGNEVAKFRQAKWIGTEIPAFLTTLSPCSAPEWLRQCEEYKQALPLVESPSHDDTAYINSYRFMQRIEPLLRPDEVIAADDGSLICPVFQALRLKPPQRVITSGCLGEMGCALPAAIGASFARGRGEVLAFVGDGGMMMNLQELATIHHHKLPVKVVVFENDGYSMIKGTFGNMKLPRRGVSKATGLSFPDFVSVARAFGLEACDVRTWADFDVSIPWLLACKGPALVSVHIDPEQPFVPRLQPIVKDGVITPARFDQLSPIHA